MKAELVKRQDRWDLYGEDGSKKASSAPNPMGKLSISNCESIANGYDLDDFIEKIIDESFELHLASSKIEKYIRIGFQKAKELLGDKKFTYNDVQRAFIQGAYAKTEIHRKKEKYMQSLQQTEWEVEVAQELIQSSIEGEVIWKTKLDADGCLILKRK